MVDGCSRRDHGLRYPLDHPSHVDRVACLMQGCGGGREAEVLQGGTAAADGRENAAIN